MIRQKGESQNGYYKKTKPAKVRKINISYPQMHMCVSGGKKCLFSEYLVCFAAFELSSQSSFAIISWTKRSLQPAAVEKKNWYSDFRKQF